ncbi:signal transduction histidine kinase [Amorphus suaedae]
MRPAPNSLARRLFFISAVWSVAAILIAGVILVALYRQSVERAFDERLDVYLKTVVGELAADQQAGEGAPTAISVGGLGEPRFALPLSGWYWTVADAKSGTVLAASPSLAGDRLALPADQEQPQDWRQPMTASITGPDREPLRVVSRNIRLPGGTRYLVSIAGDTTEVRKDVVSFGTRVAATLFAMAAGLVLAIVLQVRIGLKPLDRIRASLQAIRVGERERLEGDFPREIAPLASELNALLDSHQEVVERSRTHVGNLAHALKTPLSVILNEAREADGPFAHKVAEQAGAMQTHIAHHLDRAQIAAQRRVIGVVTPVEPVLESVVRAMRRLYEEKGISIEVADGTGFRFRGEKQDLLEVLGNLLDNGCKWAEREVRVLVRPSPDTSGALPFFDIVVEDDGPGLPPEERLRVIERGRRLDETKPGSGLGLSIVSELVRLYGGELTLAASAEGGLRAVVRLPRI